MTPNDAYVRHAKRHLRHRPRTSFVVGKAEAIPLPDNSQDAVTSIFLFHELPPKVRRSALRSLCASPSGIWKRLLLVADIPCRRDALGRRSCSYSCSAAGISFENCNRQPLSVAPSSIACPAP